MEYAKSKFEIRNSKCMMQHFTWMGMKKDQLAKEKSKSKLPEVPTDPHSFGYHPLPSPAYATATSRRRASVPTRQLALQFPSSWRSGTFSELPKTRGPLRHWSSSSRKGSRACSVYRSEPRISSSGSSPGFWVFACGHGSGAEDLSLVAGLGCKK